MHVRHAHCTCAVMTIANYKVRLFKVAGSVSAVSLSVALSVACSSTPALDSGESSSARLRRALTMPWTWAAKGGTERRYDAFPGGVLEMV